jgi:hypothetical protein
MIITLAQVDEGDGEEQTSAQGGFSLVLLFARI